MNSGVLNMVKKFIKFIKIFIWGFQYKNDLKIFEYIACLEYRKIRYILYIH